MKTKTLWLTLWAMAWLTYPGSADTLPEKNVALCMIWDAGSSNRGTWQDLHALARQSISSLKPGDYLEVISADPWEAHIRISLTTFQPDQDFSQQLQKIDCQLIGDTDVIKALELGIARMRNFVVAHPTIQPVFIVLSDGKLRDSEATSCAPLTESLGSLGWKLYFTGSKDTNRKLLVEAGQNKVHWSLLQKADCGCWIADARIDETTVQPAKEPSTPESDDVTSEPIIANPVIVLQPIIQQEPVKPEAEPIPAEPEPVDSNEPSPPVVIASVPSEPNQAPEIAVVEPNYPVSESSESNWWIFPLCGGLIVLLGVLGAIMRIAQKSSKAWKDRIDKHMKALKTTDTATLLVRYKDRTWHLGQLRRLNKIYIGSGPKNTLRLFDKEIALQHALLYVKRGTLWLKNLSSKPIVINGYTLKSRHKTHLSLPSMINLSDTVMIKCELQKHQTIPAQNKEVVHA